MKFLLLVLVLALSARTAQATPIPYNEIDRVVPEQEFDETEEVRASSTCTKQTCEKVWTDAAVLCHGAKDQKGCYEKAWHACSAKHPNNHECCGKDDSCNHLSSEPSNEQSKPASTCTKQTCETVWTDAAVLCPGAKDQKGCYEKAWHACSAKHPNNH